MCRCKRLRACRIRSARVFLVMILSLPRRRHLSGAFFQHNNKARGCLFPRRGTYGLHTRGNVTAPGTPLLSGEPARASRARDHHAQSLTCAGTSWRVEALGERRLDEGQVAGGGLIQNGGEWRKRKEECSVVSEARMMLFAQSRGYHACGACWSESDVPEETGLGRKGPDVASRGSPRRPLGSDRHPWPDRVLGPRRRAALPATYPGSGTS